MRDGFEGWIVLCPTSNNSNNKIRFKEDEDILSRKGKLNIMTPVSQKIPFRIPGLQSLLNFLEVRVCQRL